VYWYSDHKPAKQKSPTAHLLPNYDEYFIGFKDRSSIGEMLKGTGIQRDDAALLANILILDGQVIGGWKRTLKKNEVLVEASLLIGLSKARRRAVQEAAERFGQFLQLPVSLIFKDHDHEQRTSRSF
jgi:hypothetical protein